MRRFIAILLAGFVASGLRAEGAPRDSGLRESAEAELAQLEFTVRGTAAAVAAIAPSDLKVRLGLDRIEDFRLDRLCTASEGGDTPPASPPPSTPRARAHFILYLDHTHLTVEGRRRAFEIARELIPELVASGGWVEIVSNASALTTAAPFGGDVATLLAALDRIENDPREWDPYGATESSRVAEVLIEMNRESAIDTAIQTARRFQREERWRSERSMRRLTQTVARLAAVDPPKAVVYFGDTLRANAGEHYLAFFGVRARIESTSLSVMESEALTARLAYDELLREAASHGVRLFTVQAAGLEEPVPAMGPSLGSFLEADGDLLGSTVRFRDAESTLTSMARESGGASFLHAARTSKIAERIRADLSCVFLISFDPARWKRDYTYRVSVEVTKPGVEVFARGQLVIQSDAARRASRLAAAFAAPSIPGRGLGVRSALIPIDFEDGKFRALVQVGVPGLPTQGAVWDLGATLVTGNGRAVESSGRVAIPAPGGPAVFESEVRGAPGELRLVAVAHERTAELVDSVHSRMTWPDPGRGPASAGPIAILQPATAVFVRGGAVRGHGSLALAGDDAVQGDRETAFVSVVCRGGNSRAGLRIERNLLGSDAVAFPVAEFPGDHGRCAQIRDVVPAGTLGEGDFAYELRVLSDERELARAERAFATAVHEPLAEEPR